MEKWSIINTTSKVETFGSISKLNETYFYIIQLEFINRKVMISQRFNSSLIAIFEPSKKELNEF
jgi:hypothetical protein